MSLYEQITPFLTGSIFGLKAIYLFGSRAEGNAREDSDYDIAVLTNYPDRISGVEIFNLGLELGDILYHTVDLVDLHAVPLDLRFEVVAHGNRIYCSDHYFCDLYETTVISMFQRFELERRDLVAAYKKRITTDG